MEAELKSGPLINRIENVSLNLVWKLKAYVKPYRLITHGAGCLGRLLGLVVQKLRWCRNPDALSHLELDGRLDR